MEFEISVLLDAKNTAIILVAALEFALGLAIFLRSKKTREFFYFLALVFCLIIWSVAEIFSRSAPDAYSIVFFRKLTYIFSLFLPLALAYFTHSFPADFFKKNYFIFSPIGQFIFIAPVFLLSFFIWNGFLIKGLIPGRLEPFLILDKPVYAFFSVYMIAYLGFAFYRLVQNYFFADGERKSELKIILAGFLLSAILALSTNLIFPFFGVFDYLWFGPVAMLSLVVSIAYAVINRHFLNTKIIASEVLIGFILFILMSRLFFLETYKEFTLEGLVLLIIGALGYFLIRNVYQEIKTREEIERLAEELRKRNIELEKIDLAKNEFLSLASHQLFTPISKSKGYISMILEGSFGRLDKRVRDVLEKIIISDNHMIKLIEDFLNISRLEMGRLEYKFSRFQISDLLDNIKKEYDLEAKSKNLDFSVEIQGESPEIYSDREKIYQVLSNFVSNAIRYTRKGSIKIEAERREGWKKIIVSIKDTGTGLTTEEQASLFRAFKRGEEAQKINPNGVGLGLYLAKKIANELGGDVFAYSAGRNKGSVFSFEIPFKPSFIK